MLGKAAFEKTLREAAPKTVFIYSDRSQYKGNTAWAFIVYQDGTALIRRHGRIEAAEVYDTEIRGIAEAAI